MKNFLEHYSKNSPRFLESVLIIMEPLMLEKYKRLIEESMSYKTVLPSHTWLIHTLDSLVATLYDKPRKDDLVYFKRWEREKIMSLGLASTPNPLKRSPAKDIRFNSWNQEKAQSLGLVAVSTPAKIAPEQHLFLFKEKIFAFKARLNIPEFKLDWSRFALPNNKKIAVQNDNVIETPQVEDEFFKVLGYE